MEPTEQLSKPPALTCKKCAAEVSALGTLHGLCNTCWWQERRNPAPRPPEPPPTEKPAPTHEDYARDYHATATFTCATCKEREQHLVAALARTAEQPLPDALTFPPRTGSFVVLPGAIVDGDTLHFFWLLPDTARLDGMQAPELHGDRAAAGRAAKAALELLVNDQGPLRADVHGREKFGRALLDLKLPDGRSVTAVMIQLGHAVPWDGKGARPE